MILRRMSQITSVVAILTMLSVPIGALAQTRVVAPKNPYRVEEDVKAGRQAANEIERQLPLLRDSYVDSYVERIGQRLVEAVPAEFQHPEFRYSFSVVDASDLNAFALPGGFAYVNRGLIEAAGTEGELAGVMAHEISHVALRHGTAQAAKAGKYQAGSVLGQILGAVIGGGVGGVVGAASQVGFGAAFLKFSREYERQADTLGARIMADAGYDPRDLANMFRTIERQGKSGGPEWLSSHPNPGNRYEAINREAELLGVRNRRQDGVEFNQIRARLRDLPRARSMQEIGRNEQRNPTRREPSPTGYPRDESVEYPSSRYRTYNNNQFRIDVPENWKSFGNDDNLTFAPEGAYGDVQGRFVFTHGVMTGVTAANSNNLRQASDQFVQSLAQGNQNIRRQSGYQRGSIDGREALAMTLSNVSEVTGQSEIVTVYTTMLRSGEIFYVIGVAPQGDYQVYERAFQTILRSVRLNY